jgi:hypothetical protein
MIPYLCRPIGHNSNATILSDRKKAIDFPIYKGRDHSLVSNYRPVSCVDKAIPAGPYTELE